MKEQNLEQRPRMHFNVKYFEIWEDFMKTWKPVRFDEKLNSLDEKGIEEFWRKELTELTTQAEKVCILAPLKVNKNEVKEAKKEETQSDQTVNGKDEKTEP